MILSPTLNRFQQSSKSAQMDNGDSFYLLETTRSIVQSMSPRARQDIQWLDHSVVLTLQSTLGRKSRAFDLWAYLLFARSGSVKHGQE
jgi:hypothetical protein